MPSYSITSDGRVVQKGSVVTFTITTTDVPNDTVLYWTTGRFLGTITARTFVDENLEGTVSVLNNQATIVRRIATNTVTDEERQFSIRLRTNSANGPIVAESNRIVIAADPFNPKKITVSGDAGPVPSRTIFSIEQGSMQVISNGIPYPARGNVSAAKPFSVNYRFQYRAGQNTQAPQEHQNVPLGITSNGVLIKRPASANRLPKTDVLAPSKFSFNPIKLAQFFNFDDNQARVESTNYFYQTGKFLTEGWNNQQFYNSNQYYRESNFGGDYFRHADGHSKIIGFAFDGYPIYGPFGYSNALDKTSPVKLIRSGYFTKPVDYHRPGSWKYNAEKQTPKGIIVAEPGTFIEDYQYSRSRGDLDEHNGRYCITPEFPQGTYAYFTTFTDETLSEPEYPFIIGPTSKQSFNFVQPLEEIAVDDSQQVAIWNVQTGTRLALLIERSVVEILLPLVSANNITTEIISGNLPAGCRLQNNKIVGTVYEVAFNKISTCVMRAYRGSAFEDRTVEIVVTGPDSPSWQTPEGLLPVGSNNSFFILDSSPIDFQLQATDPDLSAGGQPLSYFIADGDGVLPPGITLTEDGRLQGVVEPLISLDKRFQGGGYDTAPYSGLPLDYSTVSSNGFSSFFYDTVTYDFNEPTANVRKLNRYYPFAVTVTDGDFFVRREFKIYIVSDDFLKADNTIMRSSTGVFTADNTNVRTPIWITPRNLGFRRANNYTTIYLDVIDNSTLEGFLWYGLESTNDDGSPSELPPGLSLDNQTGELVGIIPYQPTITENYKFTVRATRITTDLDRVDIFANYFEDTLLGNNSFKIFKVDLTGNIDGVNDLFDLIDRDILLENRTYKVINVDSRNPNYDVIFLDQNLAPSISLVLSRLATVGQSFIFVNRLKEKEKQKYQNRSLIFSGNESYKISEIKPYIEYLIQQIDLNIPEIYPAEVPTEIKINENYFVGDFVIYSPELGGDGKIYQCVETHSTRVLLDDDGNLILVNGVVQIDFETDKWQEVAETLTELSIEDRVAATKQALEAEFGGTAYITVDNAKEWKIKIPSTATSRIISNIKKFFANPPNTTEISVTLLRDNEDRIVLDKNLARQLNAGRNIGIALFKNDFFRESLIVAANDEVDIPSTVKTFEIQVIGEFDTQIQWITPENLGTINANYISNLRIEAETTVPDTRMVYVLKSGRLPPGMTLSYDGEILGFANQFPTANTLGLTTFDNRTTPWDGFFPGDTTFDREYRFTVEARDRFNFNKIERTFVLRVEDLDDTQYTDIYMRPLLKDSQRTYYRNFISNPDVFEPEKIYRLQDPVFGVQKNLDMLVYAGIESRKIENFVAAAAKNHKRKRYVMGNIKSAVARQPGTTDDIYEVVYIEVIDPAQATVGRTRTSFTIDTQKKITADSLSYAVKDDVTKTGTGNDALPVYGRQIIKFVFAENDKLIIETRNSDIVVDADNNDFEIAVRDDGNVSVELQLSDSEPYRFRPEPANTVKADSNAIKVSQTKDRVRYISNIQNMRTNIEQIGQRNRDFLPLWMRTPQGGFQELDYVTAIPICYCKPGFAADIIRNIRNYGFDPKQIDYEIDRYVVKRTEDYSDEKWILFANYQFNV
jgi:hypothetical protein